MRSPKKHKFSPQYFFASLVAKHPFTPLMEEVKLHTHNSRRRMNIMPSAGEHWSDNATLDPDADDEKPREECGVLGCAS